MFKIADFDDLQAIIEFSKVLKAQNARMSFTDFDEVNYVNAQLNSPLVTLFIAYDKGEIVAMFRGVQGEGLKSHSVYIACAVKKSHRQKGLATKITNYALNIFKKESILIARTKIYSWNKASIATILKCGFEESGRVVMHEYFEETDDYIDDLIFHKKL